MSHDNVYGSAAMALLRKGRLGMPTKTQMKREIVSRSALSLLAAGIQFIEIPRTYPTFDNAFNHAFKKCGLDRVYPHVFGLGYSDPQELIIQSHIQAMKSRLQGGAGRFMRAGVVMNFISLMTQTRIGLSGAMIPRA